jgi:hypothetical protein
MSSEPPRGMTFKEFSHKINKDEIFRKKYLKDPAGLVAECLHIQLTAERAEELKHTVMELQKKKPFPDLYVPGESKASLTASTGPQAH